MIVRHGQLVHSWGDIDERLEMKSVTKSMGGIVLGLAIDEDKVALTDKGDRPTCRRSARRRPRMPRRAQTDHARSACDAHGRVRRSDRRLRDRSHQSTPGTTWSYSDAGLNWLADVLTRCISRI